MRVFWLLLFFTLVKNFSYSQSLDSTSFEIVLQNVKQEYLDGEIQLDTLADADLLKEVYIKANISADSISSIYKYVEFIYIHNGYVIKDGELYTDQFDDDLLFLGIYPIGKYHGVRICLRTEKGLKSEIFSFDEQL